MTDEPENLTLRILQEMREELRTLSARVDDGFAKQGNKADGNTLLLNIVVGLVHDHEQRIDKLESR